MSISILLSFSLAMAFMFPLMMQPLSLGLVLMFSTLLMCILSGLFLSSWYAYILFLIYVGGLLVMFAYVAALMPNMLFMSKNSGFFFLALQIPLIYFFYSHMFKTLKTISYSDFNKFKMVSYFGLEFVSPLMISVFIGLAIILLANLVAVVKICYYYRSSLRPYK
uniref:NADH dehydrogenase subunit 6 n=1 Tax=Marisa cornuarietis TaxID=75126 RepID=A0A0U1XFD5_MARCO|nr:NADH dehydrogenase subunit 6 [Marisa cornuarietis]AIT57576.1 NADH dehydrogenase subunit 6 [Marisa cornuarietis]